MDSIILNMYNNYFTLLANTGHCNHKLLNILLMLDFLNDVRKNNDVLRYLSNEEIEYTNKALNCLVNNCLNQ